MANRISPHDKLFKVTMARPDVAKKILEDNLPSEIKSQIDFKTLELQNESFIDQRLKGAFVDLLYSVKFGKDKGYIYILFEHLSNPDKFIAFRMLKYMTNILDRHLMKTKCDKFPAILPIIFYTDKNNYPHSTNFFDLFGDGKELVKNIFVNPFHLINIYDIPEEKLIEQIWLGLMIKAYKSRFIEEFNLIKSLMPNLIEVDQKGGSEFISTVLHYIFEINDFDPNKILEELSSYLSQNSRAQIMTAAERLRQEGMEQGIQRGMQRGMQQGKQNAFEQVAILLLNKHRPISEIIEITGLTKEKIDQLSEEKNKR